MKSRGGMGVFNVSLYRCYSTCLEKLKYYQKNKQQIQCVLTKPKIFTLNSSWDWTQKLNPLSPQSKFFGLCTWDVILHTHAHTLINKCKKRKAKSNFYLHFKIPLVVVVVICVICLSAGMCIPWCTHGGQRAILASSLTFYL